MAQFVKVVLEHRIVFDSFHAYNEWVRENSHSLHGVVQQTSSGMFSSMITSVDSVDEIDEVSVDGHLRGWLEHGDHD